MKVPPTWRLPDPARAWRESLNRRFRFPQFRHPLQESFKRIERDRAAAQDAAARVGAWPARLRRKAAQLTLVCPSCDHAAVIVYRMEGRQLVWCRGEGDDRIPTMWVLRDGQRDRPVIEPGFHPYGACWLETVPTGDSTPLECQCRCQRWRITGRQLRNELHGDTPSVVSLSLL